MLFLMAVAIKEYVGSGRGDLSYRVPGLRNSEDTFLSGVLTGLGPVAYVGPPPPAGQASRHGGAEDPLPPCGPGERRRWLKRARRRTASTGAS